MAKCLFLLVLYFIVLLFLLIFIVSFIVVLTCLEFCSKSGSHRDLLSK